MVNFLGEKLRKLRTKNHYTQKQLGDRFGLSKAIISSYENGTRYPSYDVLIKFASLYKVSTDYLLGLDERIFFDVTDLTPKQRIVVEAVINSYFDN